MELTPLSREFYSRSTLTVAQDLLGKFLVRHCGPSQIIGRIVETEAYRGEDDPASYAFKGRNERCALMFEEAGHAFITCLHGYSCFNVVTERKGIPGAVLIRAVEPIAGIDLMRSNRRTTDIFQLSNGPGKLTQAFAITRDCNGLDLTCNDEFFIANSPSVVQLNLAVGRRIGVRAGADKLWRFYIKDNLFVSKG